MKNILVVLFFLLGQNALYAQLNVKEFGAKGDGHTMDTRFIQQAIDKVSESRGGMVIVPAGTYKIGTLILKDNVNLHLAAGALLLGSPDYKDYTAVSQKYESRTRDLYARYFMIFAEGAKNISITGSGIIHGNGLTNFQEVKPQNLRPYMIRLVSCNNVTLNGISLLEAANWTLHLLGCKDVNVNNIVIENEGEGNRDGLDIDGCERVTVANSRFSTTDDAIVMKATSDTICQDVAITNCTFRKIGGSALKTGTESNGGFKNITISNCVIKDIPVHAGIELMTVDGGLMQNILIENITMDNVATPFFIRLGIRARPYKTGQYVKRIDEVKDITLNNISAINAKLPSSIIGLHNNKIENITISNYTARYAYTEQAAPYNKVPFQEFEYPAAAMFSKLPAYGIYCRSVDGLHLQNISLYTAENEKRPAITLDRVNNPELFAVKAEVKQANSPMVYIRNSKGITAAFCRTIGVNNTMFEIEGQSNSNIHLYGNILSQQQKESRIAPPLTDSSVFEDFDTQVKYSVGNGTKIQGLPAHDLKKPLNVKLDTRKGTLQLCLLALNSAKKTQKVFIKYDGITQEFLITWNEWGWAPISLLKEYQHNQKVEFEIVPEDPGTNIKIAKVYLRYQDIDFTD